MNRGRCSVAWLLLAQLVAAPVLGQQERSVEQWLDRMALAVSGLTYQGTLVYTRGSRIDAMRILHRADESGIRERLVALSGSPREVLRDNETVRCIFPDSQSILVDSRMAERLFPSIPPDQLTTPGGRYRLELGGIERVAQLDARIIHIIPRDDFRYGYRLWLEENTGMLLKSSLMASDGKPVEQLMFTDIRIGGSIPDSALMPDLPDSGYVEVEIPREMPAHEQASEQAHWTVGALPEGFLLTSHRHSGSEDGARMEHLIFSDGLASVSVYVESGKDRKGALSGPVRLGAVSMYGVELSGHAVTVVGEVPLATVRQMAQSVRASKLAAR